MNFAVSRNEIEKWAADMVSIPSYPGIPEQEMKVAQYIKTVFDNEGINCQIDTIDDGRANVIAVVEGSACGKSLMLNGHMDTVPPYDMENACRPWVENGYLHGRGTGDMKGELAAAMAALISIKRQGRQYAGDVIFSGVADEEEGSLGCIRMIQAGYHADACVVCEGLGLDNIYVYQKGLEWYQIDFTGKTVHGGCAGHGINAIEKASHFIYRVEKELKPMLTKRTSKYGSESTVNIAVIKGGTQPSTVAGECQILLDRRFIPEIESYENVTSELQLLLDQLMDEDPDFHARLSVFQPSIMKDGFVHQGFITDEEDPIVSALRKAVTKIRGLTPMNAACPAWTDGGLISHYTHTSVVIYGPGGNSYHHSKEEAVSLDELFTCARIYQQLAEYYCTQ